jgi:hypothetical protein
MSRYEIVRKVVFAGNGFDVIQRHPDQPANGFGSAMEASLWCETPPRDLGGEWYIRPVEGT